MAQQQIIDERVGGERQMVAVLLDGGGGQDQQRRFARQRVHLLPIQIGEIARVGDPGFHLAAFVADSATAWILAFSFRFEGDHFTWIHKTFGIVALLGEQLHVVGTIAAAAFDVVHMRIGDKDADLAAEIDHFVQPRFAW